MELIPKDFWLMGLLLWGPGFAVVMIAALLLYKAGGKFGTLIETYLNRLAVSQENQSSAIIALTVAIKEQKLVDHYEQEITNATLKMVVDDLRFIKEALYHQRLGAHPGSGECVHLDQGKEKHE